MVARHCLPTGGCADKVKRGGGLGASEPYRVSQVCGAPKHKALGDDLAHHFSGEHRKKHLGHGWQAGVAGAVLQLVKRELCAGVSRDSAQTTQKLPAMRGGTPGVHRPAPRQHQHQCPSCVTFSVMILVWESVPDARGTMGNGVPACQIMRKPNSGIMWHGNEPTRSPPRSQPWACPVDPEGCPWPGSRSWPE